MSLISDALKKADASPGNPQAEPPAPPRSLWLYRAALIGSVGIVLAGLALVTRRPPVTAARSANASATAATVPAKSSGAQLLRMAQGEMGLSGTLLGGAGEPLALIDNQVVQKGDKVRGMQVVQVNPDSVQLEDRGGRIKTLKLRD